jgi:cell wall-associated NlpC family hydrolase
MRKILITVAAALCLAAAPAGRAPRLHEPARIDAGFWDRAREIIESRLGLPYVWGAAGLKSFDCSGFVWRTLWDSGYFMKRTTARKLYMALESVPQQKEWTFGNIVFFDGLKHCGIVAGPRAFYHAQSSIGTNLSRFDPYWRRKVCAVRALPSE